MHTPRPIRIDDVQKSTARVAARDVEHTGPGDKADAVGEPLGGVIVQATSRRAGSKDRRPAGANGV
jgi:hypothetical protein